MSDEPEIIRDPTNASVDVDAELQRQPKVNVRGLSQTLALDIFFMLVDKGYAVSVKHLGGYYFVEVPVGLVGDPAYGQTAEIQTLAKRAGCATIQTGNTLRVIG